MKTYKEFIEELDDLQAEWKKRKTKLALTGKFLPDNSALKGL